MDYAFHGGCVFKVMVTKARCLSTPEGQIYNKNYLNILSGLCLCRLVQQFLAECGVPYTHLFVMSPFRRRKRVRGSAQRNKGIEWIRNHPLPRKEKGIVFFADDDNTYDPRIFKEVNAFIKLFFKQIYNRQRQGL